MSKKKILFFLILISFTATAQVNDAGLWTSLNIEKKFSKRFALTLSQEFRLNENISELGTTFTELSVDVKIKGVKGLSLSPGYRFIQRRNIDDSYSVRHRALFDLNYRYKTGAFSITLRERFQSQVADVITGEDGFLPVNYLRNKISLKYAPDKKKYAPWISAEVFYQLNNNEGNEIDNLRYAAGLDYDLTKKHAISAFYMINKEVNVNDAWIEYIIGVGYKFTFGEKVKKKEEAPQEPLPNQ